MEAIGRLLRTPPRARSFEGIEPFLEALADADTADAMPESTPIPVRTLARAIRLGPVADRLGFAFVAGYHAALVCLAAQSGSKRVMPVRASLAVTETGGLHPRAITTKLSPDPKREDMLRLDGEKTFATLGTVADVLLVAATEGTGDDGRPKLRLVRVGARASGVTIEPRDPTPFAPEVPHARVKLENVAVSPLDVLPGDGYAKYIKPFRTLEDMHVLAATLAWLASVAKTHDLPKTLQEAVVAQLHALASIAAAPEGSAHAHVALAGVFANVRSMLVVYGSELRGVPEPFGERLTRDLPLLEVAETARAARTAAAWQAIANARPSVAPPANPPTTPPPAS